MIRKTMVLVVDDEARLVRLVRANLESVGYRVISANDGMSALDIVEAEEPDLIILDLIMPGMDGYEVCKKVREFSGIPIIMLTARSEEEDKVRGLNLGADDYLTKPFGADELLARVNAVLRRSKTTDRQDQPTVYVCGNVTIDFSQHKVAIRGEEVNLSPTEYKLFCYLVTNSGKVMLHEDLLRRVWGPEYREELDYLRVYIRYLRQKIELDPGRPTYIVSKPGVGYMFNAQK